MKYLIIFAILLASCTPEQRLARLLKRNPRLVKVDTTFKSDTILIKGSSTDTIFKHTITRDTLIIRDHQQTIKYYNDGKTVYLKGEVRDTTIIREVPVIVNSVSVEPETWGEKTWRKVKDFIIVFLLGAVLVILFVLWLYIKRKGNEMRS